MSARPIRNKFAGKCERCGVTVAPGDGLAEKVIGRWQINHVACPAPVPPQGLPPAQALRNAGLGGHEYRTEFERDHDEGDRG